MIGAPSAALPLRARGPLAGLSTSDRLAIVDRSSTTDPTVRSRTTAIIDRVRAEGDAALLAFARDFDRVELPAIEVPRAAWEAALNSLNPALRAVLERSARNIATVHHAFRPVATECAPEPGIRIGRRPDPLARVGIYAPGGRAAYPSSLLMGAIPARVASVHPQAQTACRPPWCSLRRPWLAWIASLPLAAPERSRRWPLAPPRCLEWTASWGRVMPSLPKQSCSW